jgi:beta-lactamase class C
MIKLKYIIPLILIVLAVTLYFSKEETQIPVKPTEIASPPEKKDSKMDSLLNQYDSLIVKKLNSQESVGAALVITYKNEIAWLRCYGVKETGKKDSINEETVFRLASVSKTITGVLAGILSEENILPLDDKVIDYLPNFKLKDSINTYDLSIRNILSHTSGLVPHAYDNLVEADVPFNIIIDSLQHVNIAGEPGKYYGYQNVVYSLYDTIVKTKTSKSFNEILHEKVFLPFEMNQASANFQDFATNPNIAIPHISSRGKFKSIDLNDKYYNTAPAAGINASISDMAHFLIALSGSDTSFLTKKVTNEVLSPQIVSPLRWNYLSHWDKVDSKYYGIGWRIIGYKGRRIAYHGGYVRGYRAEIAFCPEDELGIAFLTNSPGSVGSYTVPIFLNMFFEMKEKEKKKSEVLNINK